MMQRNQPTREMMLRQEYNALSGAEREGEKGQAIRAEIKKLNKQRLQGGSSSTPIMC